MSVPSDVIRALVTGDHGDPFAVLGPHPGPKGMVTVRAFIPDAQEVSVIPLEAGDGPTPLDRKSVV